MVAVVLMVASAAGSAAGTNAPKTTTGDAMARSALSAEPASPGGREPKPLPRQRSTIERIVERSDSPANRAQESLTSADGRGTGPAAVRPPQSGGADVTRGLTERQEVSSAQARGRSAPSMGGCLVEYGDSGQCLPAIPPSMAQHVREMTEAGLDPASMPHPWSCAEVRQYFVQGITVRQPGVDPQRLDADRDGVACGSGD